MTDRYQSLIQNPVGQFLAKNLGLPNPPELKRWNGGRLVEGTVLLGGEGEIVSSLPALLKNGGIDTTTVRADGKRYQGLVFDATALDSAESLVKIQEFFTPVLRQLASCGRIVVLGRPVNETTSTGAAIAQRALEGFVRSAAKEIGSNGSTANLVYVNKGAEGDVASTLEFLLSPKSAFVDGQVVRVGSVEGLKAIVPADAAKPLAGKVALVTGASRGLGEAMARTLHRDGATIIGLDVPPLQTDLDALMKELDGSSIIADITADDAAETIAASLKDGVDFVIHNAESPRSQVSLATTDRPTTELLRQA